MTSCDHTVVVTDRARITGVKEPGFSFTGLFENIAYVIDLRDQLRAFHVEAITRDGIRIKVLTFVAFRISRDGKRPESDKPFPFSGTAVLKALGGSLVERWREQKDGKIVEHKQMHTWDEMVIMVATRVLRRVISEYSFDDLCATLQPERNPRNEITTEFQRQLRDRLGTMGTELVRGGISNLLPVDDQPLRQRIRYWQAGQERKSTAEIAKGTAEYIRIVESARAQTREAAEQMTSDTFDKTRSVDKNVSAEEIALRFLEVLERLVNSLTMQRSLSSASETVEAMRRSLEAHRH